MTTTSKTWDQIHAELSAPFPLKDIEWRDEYGKGQKLPYVTARAVMDRLDQVVGAGNWEDRYERVEIFYGKDKKECGFICQLSIQCPEKNDEWPTRVTKSDGGEVSNFAPLKGGISAAFKRAAVKWGIGRYLYKLPKNASPQNFPKWALPADEQPEQVEEAPPSEDGVDHVAACVELYAKARSKAGITKANRYAVEHSLTTSSVVMEANRSAHERLAAK